MFSTRTDQENLTYDHQRAAAAKPLNQPLGTKTPGNKAPKTPFRKQLNDENDTFNTGFKTGKKGGDGNLFTKGKKATTELDNAFITPAGPRNRAPLGMKTTNAKGALLKTPAPKESAQKNVSPRMRRAKVKILHEGAEKATEELAEPDVEYMPPRSIPLPDYPDDDLHNETWDMLRGANQTNGWYGIHMNPVGADGLTRLDREMAKIMEGADRHDQETIRKALANDPLDIDNLARYLEQPQPSRKAPSAGTGNKTSTKRPDPLKRATSSLSSKRAASALAKHSTAATNASASRFPAPTANTSARTRAPLPASRPDAAPLSRKPISSATAPTAASMRHAAASTTSRSTLGYSKGRVVSASTKQPLSGLYDRSAPTSAPTSSITPSATNKTSAAGLKPSSGTVRPTTSSSTRSVSLSTRGVDKSPAFAKQKDLMESLLAEDPEMETLMLERNGSVDADAEMKDTIDGIGGMNFQDETDELEDFQLVMDDSDDPADKETAKDVVQTELE